MIDEKSQEWLKIETDTVNVSLDERLRDMIDEADPLLTGRKDIYAEALRLVSSCEDISQVVSLVNWLIALSYHQRDTIRKNNGE